MLRTARPFKPINTLLMTNDAATAAVWAQTQHWLEKVVLGLDLCPFARTPIQQGRLRHRVEWTTDPDVLSTTLVEELTLLEHHAPAVLETTLLIHPHCLNDFLEYNDYLEFVDEILEKLNWVGIFQVASFHPHYQFADLPATAIEHHTNRSPYPMLHLLREDSVRWAVAHYAGIEDLPERNQDRLRALGHAGLAALLRGGPDHPMLNP